MKINKNIYIPLSIFLVSFLIRFCLISKGPYHIDTLQLILKGQTLLDSHRLEMRSGLGFPLSVILSAGFIFLAKVFSIGDPVFAVNFMSVVTSSLSVLFFYLLVEKLFNKKTAFFSSILFSLSPLFLGLSVYGKSHTPSLLFLFISIYFILLWRERKKTKTFLCASIFIALMGATRILDMALLFLPLSLLILWSDRLAETSSPLQKKKQLWKQVFLFWITAIPLILTFYLPFFIDTNSASHKTYFLNDLRIGLTENFMGLCSPRLLVTFDFLRINTTTLGLILVVLSLFFLFTRKKPLFFILFFWILIPLIAYGNLHTTVAPRYFVTLLPALYICIGFILSYFSNQNKIKTALSLLLFLYILTYSWIFMYPALKARHENAILPAFAQWTEKMIPDNGTIICGDESAFFRYYTQLNILGRPMDFFAYSEETLANYQKRIDSLLNEAIPVYIHTGSLYAYNKNEQFSNLFWDNYTLTYIGTHPYEDWHKGEMELQIYPFDLFKIDKKAIPIDEKNSPQH